VKSGAASLVQSDFFRVYDCGFRLRSQHADARRLFRQLYADFLLDGAQEPGFEASLEPGSGPQFAWRAGDESGEASTLEGALWALEAAVCERIIRSQENRIAIHGAAVYGAESTAILLGQSGSGKSTLAVALARRGFVVASDDVTFVDPKTLHLQPMPRCFHLDSDSVSLLEADGLRFPRAWEEFRFMTPADLRAGPVPSRRADHLIFMPGARGETAEIVPISQAEMASRVLSETGKGNRPESVEISALVSVTAAASCYRLDAGPLTATADAVARCLRGQMEKTQAQADTL
jgi:hypothetical protein